MTAQDRDRILKAVEKAETQTSAQIVPFLVGRSDAYPGAAWRLAFVVGVLICYGSHWLAPEIAFHIHLFALIAGVVLGLLAFRLQFVARLALRSAEIDEEVQQRALQAFVAEGLGGGALRGVLLFVSLLEHRVVVMPDRALLAKLGQGPFDALVASMVAQLKKGTIAMAFEEAVAACGTLLGPHFPKEAENISALSNQLREG